MIESSNTSYSWSRRRVMFFFICILLVHANLCTHMLVYADDYMAFSHEVHIAEFLRVLTREAEGRITDNANNARRS